ncbi:hypothetical protein L1987_58427 [Smallanthus sonchifolius]|uniref:Uncharacterized protein n=1 Tax=Smallanthus sonchifolius TaxID=185202 RepID=A0ACB9DGB5_9ASTR|nr:hypothetical protein L1987_58427 [Smallanthus sonchifolius]
MTIVMYLLFVGILHRTLVVLFNINVKQRGHVPVSVASNLSVTSVCRGCHGGSVNSAMVEVPPLSAP